MSADIKFLAYYLPQFHPIPENNQWWGKGFTEWANVTKAKPLFRGHNQPVLPSELGFYDLRVSQTQEEQSKLALEYGIDGFIYYQYWFGSKMLLESPAEKMLANKNIEIPFCFCWANETWKGIWHGLDNPDVLIEQTYPKDEIGYIEYFNYLLPFFKDSRYIKMNEKPMFQIYRANDIPNKELFFETFTRLAKENGFKGIYFVITSTADSGKYNDDDYIDAKISLNIFNNLRYFFNPMFSNRYLRKIELIFKEKLGYTSDVVKRNKPLILDYKSLIKHFNEDLKDTKSIPCAIPNWDNSARSGNKSLILHKASPEHWKTHLKQTVDLLKRKPDNPRFIVIKSWNEWAEGNHLEPDTKFGREWLQVIKEVKEEI